MKSRPNQSGARENTASSRQHAPRLAVDTPSNPTCIDVGSPEAQWASPQIDSSGTVRNTTSHAAPQLAATDVERTDESRLLTIYQVAELLQVPVSWVYEHTRGSCADRIPGFRLGKYWRFGQADTRAWIRHRRVGLRGNPYGPEYNGSR